GRCVGDAEAEAEARPGDLVQVGRSLPHIEGGAGVDVRDRGSEVQGLRGVGEREAKAHGVAEARAVDAGEAATLDLAGQLQGREAAAGYTGQRKRGKLHHALRSPHRLRAARKEGQDTLLAALREDS